MATIAPPVPQDGMTKAELLELMRATAADALGPLVEKAFAPLAKAQGDLAERLLNLGRKEPDAQEFDDKILGKHPVGRKALLCALAAIEGIPLSDPDAMAKAAKKHWRPSLAASAEKWLSHVKTTLTVGNAATAGDMVIPQIDTEWIELLRNNAVIRAIARTLPMPKGALSRRRQTGAATAGYGGELGLQAPSNLTVGRENLSYKKLSAVTVVGNDLIRFAGGEADRMAEEDLLRVSALREDRAFIVGNPPVDAGSPKGIRFWTAAANIFASAGATLTNFQADLTKAIRLVQASNVPATPQNSYFLLSPSTFWTIYALATTTGDMIFAAMLSAPTPTLFGFPVRLTTQLEVTNPWMGANTGMIIFCYAPGLEIHDSMSRTVEAFRGGAYKDELNVVQSGISNDETVITCIGEHDFLQVYPTGAAIITGYAT